MLASERGYLNVLLFNFEGYFNAHMIFGFTPRVFVLY